MLRRRRTLDQEVRRAERILDELDGRPFPAPIVIVGIAWGLILATGFGLWLLMLWST